MNKAEVEKLLRLYPIRKAEIEEIKLRLEELEIDPSLIGAITYEERVQSSSKCSNNDKAMELKTALEKRLKLYEISIRRAKNLLNLIRNRRQRAVIEMICLESMSINEVAKEIDRTRQQVNNLYKSGINAIVTTEITKNYT